MVNYAAFVIRKRPCDPRIPSLPLSLLGLVLLVVLVLCRLVLPSLAVVAAALATCVVVTGNWVLGWERPEKPMTLGQLSNQWRTLTRSLVVPQREILIQLKTIVQGSVIQLPNEKCVDGLCNSFHENLRAGAPNISTSLEFQYKLLNELLESFLGVRSMITENYEKGGQAPERMKLSVDTLFGKVTITIIHGNKGGWRKESLQVLIDLPSLNDQGIRELPPLLSELRVFDNINPSWYLCVSTHGMIKFGCEGQLQRATGVRLSLWFNPEEEKWIVGTAHTTLKSNKTGQQQAPDSWSRLYRSDLEKLSDVEIKTLYGELDALFKEIKG